MKRLVILALTLCLLATGLFAIGNRAASSAGSANEVTLTMINRVNPEVATENNRMFQYIRERYGFNIQLEAPPISGYNDRLWIVMASGDLPDIVYFWGLNNDFARYVNQGLFNPLDDHIKNYPNLVHNISQAQFLAGTNAVDGKIYAIPRPNGVQRVGYLTNLRWLNRLGISAPTTLDEFFEYGRLVRDNDPDGNGRADTYLLSPDKEILNSSNHLIRSFIPPDGQPDWNDGVYKVRERMTGYLPFLDFMRRLYEERMLDPEYVVNSVYGGRDKVYGGRVATVEGHDGVLSDSVLNNNGNFDFISLFPPIKGTDGIARHYVGAPTWGGWALPASSSKTQDALRFLDWGNSPVGFEIFNCGVPGVTYTSYNLQNRTIVQTEEQKRLWPTVTSTYMTIANAYEGLSAYVSDDPRIAEYHSRAVANFLSVVQEITNLPFQNPEMDRFRADNPDLITRKTEMEDLYVTGTVTRADFVNFINTQYLPRVAPAEAAYQRIMAGMR